MFPIRVPPLRGRATDIPLLVNFFVNKHAKRMGKRVERVPAETMHALSRLHWPGNARELENVIERALILCQGPVLNESLAEGNLECDFRNNRQEVRGHRSSSLHRTADQAWSRSSQQAG